MCIIILTPTSVAPPSRDVLAHCWEQNPDNAGVMFAMDDKVHIWKSNDMEEFIQGYMDIHKDVSSFSPVIAHFRYRTHGKVDFRNTHPFYIDKENKAAFCHNGVIRDCSPSSKSKKSDTLVFRDTILRELPLDMLKDSDGIQYLLGNYIEYSKLAFLFWDGTYRIVNEDKGVWEDDIWYSNDTFKKSRAAKVTAISSYRTPMIAQATDNVCGLCGSKGAPTRTIFRAGPGRYHEAYWCDACLTTLYMTDRLKFVPSRKNPYGCYCCGKDLKSGTTVEFYDADTMTQYDLCIACSYHWAKGEISKGDVTWFVDETGIDWDTLQDLADDKRVKDTLNIVIRRSY